MKPYFFRISPIYPNCTAPPGNRAGTSGDRLFVGEGRSSEAGPHIRGEPREFVDMPVVFRQYCCPGCYVALLSEIVPAEETQYRLKRLAYEPAARA